MQDPREKHRRAVAKETYRLERRIKNIREAALKSSLQNSAKAWKMRDAHMKWNGVACSVTD